MEQDLNAVTRHWYDRTRTVEKAHFTRCALFRRRHVALGCVTIVCTSLLGVLSNLSPDHGLLRLQIFGLDVAKDSKVLLTILAPVLTALVSFLRFDEKSSMHHNAAARFASMKRRLHIIIAGCSAGCDQNMVRAELEKICEKWDALTLQAPALYLKEASFIRDFDEASGKHRSKRRPASSPQLVAPSVSTAEAA
jgi:hypothetical protein